MTIVSVSVASRTLCALTWWALASGGFEELMLAFNRVVACYFLF